MKQEIEQKLTNPTLSIVIPTFNAAKTISAAIDSILSQDFHSYEILIIDGKSTDQTVPIVKDFQQLDKRVVLVSEEDEGIYDAMNKGISMAKGSWLFFLGSDDILFHPEVLTHVFNDSRVKDHDVIYGDVYSYRFNGLYDGEFTARKLLDQNICHQSVFFNKSVFKTVGGFSTMYKMHADWEHNIRWFFNRQITHTYINLTVSNYADGGLSSILGDVDFTRDKLRIYFRYAYRHIDKTLRRELLNRLICTPGFSFIQTAYFKFLFHLNGF